MTFQISYYMGFSPIL